MKDISIYDKNTQIRLAVTAGLIVVLVILIFASAKPDIEKVNIIAEEEEVLPEIGREVDILYTAEGALKAKIIAPELKRYEAKTPYTEFEKGLRLYFYNDLQELDSKLSARYGIIWEHKDEMLVRDSVVILNTEGEKLSTEELVWKRKEQKIFSDKFVTITTPTEIIYGNGFEANEDFSDYMIKDITGTVLLDADELE